MCVCVCVCVCVRVHVCMCVISESQKLPTSVERKYNGCILENKIILFRHSFMIGDITMQSRFSLILKSMENLLEMFEASFLEDTFQC